MAAPIDYTLNVQQNPAQAFTSGYGIGQGIRNDIQQQQDRQAAMAAQAAEAERQNTIIRDLLTKKNPTADDYADASILLPGGMREQIDQAWKMRNTAQQESALKDMGQAYSAILSGRPDVAVQQMQAKADAMEKAGASPGEVQALRTNAQVIQQNPNLGALTIHRMLSFVPGGDKVIQGLSGAGTEQRAQALAPGALAKTNAEATTAQVTAANAPAKQAADIEQTKAQTEQSRATVDKIRTEIDNAGGAGGLDPEKRFDFESKLRKEYSTQTAGYQETKEAYNRIKASENNAVGDLSLIFAYMKMLDPGSVVREGEFANAQNAAGVPERVQNIYNKIASGERLTDGQRKAFKGQAEGLLKAAEQREKTVRSGIDQVVKSYKLNPSNVFYQGEAPAVNAAAPNGLPPSLANKSWAKY